jgi:hypothetical protein
METWKTIPGFSRYEASTLGRLRSNNYKRTGKTKVLKPALCLDGYMKTMLQDDNKKYRSWTVHKFVTLAFYGEKGEGIEVNHKNGNKTDNRIENLEYCTRSHNMKHACRTGLMKPKRGSKNGHSKLTEKQVIEIRKHAKEKGRRYGRDKLAEKYGVSSAHIKDIVNRRRNSWPHV